MSLARNVVLWAGHNRWLREHLPRYRFVRASVRRFMPGETTDEAIAAANRLGGQGLPTMFTLLGENVTNLDASRRVADDYRATYDRIVSEGLDTEISVKPSHLGVDLDPDAAMANLEELATVAGADDNWLWLDMESAEYVDPRLDLYRKLRAGHRNVGIALQAYLKRTADDVDSLMPLEPTIRLVTGAYKEPREIVFGSREVMAEAYRRVGLLILARKGPGGRLALGTHGLDLVRQIRSDAHGRERFEVHMLYGIRSADQLRLGADGYQVRTLISYGSHWYPWYMRRIAEKPVENTLLALRNLISRG